MTKDLLNKTNEELAILALRLKLQILEARFSKASGSEKKVNVKQIKKMIARILTVLRAKGYALSLGMHGVSIIELKTNKQTSLNKLAGETITAAEKELMKNNDQFSLNETLAEKKATTGTVKNEEAPLIIKKDDNKIKSQTATKQKKQVIHKTTGGGS